MDLAAGELAAGRRLRLDLGAVRDVAEVEVNGVPAGRLLWRPYRVDVTEALHPGTNRIAVRVTNTNANERGIAQASGLLGPVTLRPYRVERVRLDRARGTEAFEITAAPREVELSGCLAQRVDVTVANFGRRPLSGEVTLAAPAGVTVTAPDTRVRLERHEAVTLPVEVSGEGSGTLTADFRGQRATVRLLAGGDANLARGAVVSASSTLSRFDEQSVVDGATDSSAWDQGDGWNDATLGAFPDWVELRLPCAEEVGRVDVHTLDSAQFPAARFGVRDFDVQVLRDGQWATVREVRGSTAGLVSATFPAVTTDAVRVLVHATNDGGHSRLIEVEVYRE